jgi:hypothetical protein
MKDAITAARKRQVNPLRELSLKNRRMFITILNTRRLLMPPENQHVYCENQISKTNTLKGTIDELKFLSHSESHILEAQRIT